MRENRMTRSGWWYYILWLILAVAILWPILARGEEFGAGGSGPPYEGVYPDGLRFLSGAPAVDLGECPPEFGPGVCFIVLDVRRPAVYLVVRNGRIVSRVWIAEDDKWILIYARLETSKPRIIRHAARPCGFLFVCPEYPAAWPAPPKQPLRLRRLDGGDEWQQTNNPSLSFRS